MEKWYEIKKGADFQAIAERFGISPVTARLIRNRGVIGDAAIDKYLNGTCRDLYDPHLLYESEKLVCILSEKIRQGRPIRIIGDYDIDGVMSTYILYQGITRCGGSVSCAIPDRMRDGYGINEHLIDAAYEEGMDTIITCDNGIAAINEIAHAKELGMTVLVTDHHEIPYIPLDRDGSFRRVEIAGKIYFGKSLYDALEGWIRKGRYSTDERERQYGRDIMWFVWSNENSPLYGKDKMTTFERYFLADKESYAEEKNAYYRLCDDEETVERIFREFGIDPDKGHIINGHVPVKVKKGESPVHCGGKVIIIDGGFSRAYQKVTGIAGYTLVSDSRTVKLIAHEPFVSTQEAVLNERDIHSASEVIRKSETRLRVKDTDTGREMEERIADLEKLLEAYRCGALKERN